MKVLIVEDDHKITGFLEKGLREEGYVTHCEKNGAQGLDAAMRENWDVIILDRMLPGLDGLEFCRRFRRDGHKTPVLILSARGETENRIEGLDAGADDYLPKPFSFSELLARLRALLRRPSEATGATLKAGELTLDLVSHHVFYRDKKIPLTTREFGLLQLFMRRQGHVLSRTVIAESVWEYDFQSGTNVVDVYVNYLRKKIKKAAGRDMIQTIRHRGYLFETAP
jgi:DNA-binding response OmpR family regulator